MIRYTSIATIVLLTACSSSDEGISVEPIPELQFDLDSQPSVVSPANPTATPVVGQPAPDEEPVPDLVPPVAQPVAAPVENPSPMPVDVPVQPPANLSPPQPAQQQDFSLPEEFTGGRSLEEAQYRYECDTPEGRVGASFFEDRTATLLLSGSENAGAWESSGNNVALNAPDLGITFPFNNIVFVDTYAFEATAGVFGRIACTAFDAQTGAPWGSDSEPAPAPGGAPPAGTPPDIVPPAAELPTVTPPTVAPVTPPVEAPAPVEVPAPAPAAPEPATPAPEPTPPAPDPEPAPPAAEPPPVETPPVSSGAIDGLTNGPDLANSSNLWSCAGAAFGPGNGTFGFFENNSGALLDPSGAGDPITWSIGPGNRVDFTRGDGRSGQLESVTVVGDSLASSNFVFDGASFGPLGCSRINGTLVQTKRSVQKTLTLQPEGLRELSR